MWRCRHGDAGEKGIDNIEEKTRRCQGKWDEKYSGANTYLLPVKEKGIQQVGAYTEMLTID